MPRPPQGEGQSLRIAATIATRKVASTTDDYAGGVAEGILEPIAVEGLAPGAHACTVATNALLEGALIITEGFRDVLEMRRIRVLRCHDPLYERPPRSARGNGVSRSRSGWVAAAMSGLRGTRRG
ncbi:hydantoinase/oxoprolinase N-terminal domain-containing protein [Paenirhodobacter sp.]|uniref:hydantoinase/oxoprolinase N-terminal domain-containing protein n=1 Tax=Paenirhodobacter sp. TaxID=1965326 RepID=UPI003B3F3E38